MKQQVAFVIEIGDRDWLAVRRMLKRLLRCYGLKCVGIKIVVPAEPVGK